MKKSEFVSKIAPFILENGLTDTENQDLLKITADSRDVQEGSIFFCEKGSNVDGHDFISKALEKGAYIVVGEKSIDSNRYIKVSSVKKVLSFILPEFYKLPDRKMKTIGITGTNGKTSISLLVERFLKDCFSCGITGTLGYRYAGREINAANTTPVNWKWYDLLNDMTRNGVELLISEVSSHALSENRIESTAFDVAVFTNLSRDHLDFHKDIEDYYQAKKKLFTVHLKEGAVAVVNVDDNYGKRLYGEIFAKVRTIRISENDRNAEMKFRVLNSSSAGSVVLIENKDREVRIPLVGRFNIYNMLSAFAVAEELIGKDAYKAVSKGIVIPGRLEKIGNSSVFVDYAHTPDALENVLRTLNEISDNRVITVFGAGGDRDRGKRSEMGRIVTEYSRISIITDDNPRTEDPDRIVEDIFQGCNTHRSVVEIIRDRSAAIKRAIELAEKGDLVLVAGKGAENYQITGDGKRYFSDKEEIEKYIGELHNVYNRNN